MKNKITNAAYFVVGLMLAFSATAFAATAVAPTDSSWTDLLQPVWDAFRAGHYAAAGASAVVLAVALAKKYLPGKAGGFLNGKIGSSIAVLVGSFAGSVAVATSDGTGLGWNVVKAAGAVSIAAAGGYTLIKDLLIDPLTSSAWYANKAPAWLKACMGVVLFVFSSKNPDAPAMEKAASDAGKAAVAANPPTGAAGVAGKPTDL